MTTPNTIIAIDLVDLQKIETKGFKYLLNGIDMSSIYIWGYFGFGGDTPKITRFWCDTRIWW